MSFTTVILLIVILVNQSHTALCHVIHHSHISYFYTSQSVPHHISPTPRSAMSFTALILLIVILVNQSHTALCHVIHHCHIADCYTSQSVSHRALPCHSPLSYC